MNADVSIIIVSFNTRDLLARCLQSIEQQESKPSIETFVVDNASHDGSPDLVAEKFPTVNLIRSDTNAGFAAANNLALTKTAGRYVMLLNSDTRLGRGAVAELVAFMEDRPRAGYCGPKLLNDDGTHQPSARRFPTVLSTAYSMTGLDRRHVDSRHTLDLHGSHGERDAFGTDWLTGACLFVRSDVVRQVGLMDDGFFLYFEETDWCQKMAAAGWEGWYVPSAEVVHLGGQSVSREKQAAPFSGDHPEYWVSSSRRYMRRYHGVLGMLVSELIQVGLYVLVWMRHRFRRSDTSRLKARTAAAALRYLTVGA